MTTAYHPQADGQAEKTNQTVETMLRIFIASLDSSDATKWVDYIPALELAHNTTPNLATGHAPYELLYGTSPQSFGDRTLMPPSLSTAAEDLTADLMEKRALAEESLVEAQASQKKHYDKRHTPLTFNPGDAAILRLKAFRRGGKRKLEPTGMKVKIIEKVSPVAYRIQVPTGSRIHDVISIEHLRPYLGDPDLDPENQAIQDEWIEEQPLIEEICGIRQIRGRKEVLVRWRDCPQEEATWERAADVPAGKLASFETRWKTTG